jgi:hypothetical protein
MAKKKKQVAQERSAASGTFEEVSTTKEDARPKQKKNKKS